MARPVTNKREKLVIRQALLRLEKKFNTSIVSSACAKYIKDRTEEASLRRDIAHKEEQLKYPQKRIKRV